MHFSFTSQLSKQLRSSKINKSPAAHFCSTLLLPKSSALHIKIYSFPNMVASFQVVSCSALSPASIYVSLSGSVFDMACSPRPFTVTAPTAHTHWWGKSHRGSQRPPNRTVWDISGHMGRGLLCTFTIFASLLNGVCSNFFKKAQSDMSQSNAKNTWKVFLLQPAVPLPPPNKCHF